MLTRTITCRGIRIKVDYDMLPDGYEIQGATLVDPDDFGEWIANDSMASEQIEIALLESGNCT